MILITWGLLTLLAFSHAGGDHIKGGSDHIKGGSVVSSSIKSVPQALIQQEEVAPAVITKTSVPVITARVLASAQRASLAALTNNGAVPFGLKTAQASHELNGKMHSTAKLQQTAAVPVAQIPVIQVVDADANEPGQVQGFKTAFVSNAPVGETDPVPAAASVKGLKTFDAAGNGKTQFSILDTQMREPVAKPIPYQSVLRNQEFNTDIKLLNQQLMKKQNEEELQRTLAGIVSPGSDIAAVTLTEAELNDISLRIGVNPLIPILPDSNIGLQRQRTQLRPVIPGVIQRKPEKLTLNKPVEDRKRIPAIPKLPVIGRAPIVAEGFGQRIRYTGTRMTTSRLQDSERIIIPGQIIDGTSIVQGQNMKLFLGNTVGNIAPGNQQVITPKYRVPSQIIPKPQIITPVLPNNQIPSSILPQPEVNTDIVEFNRKLMQKQSEEEIKRTLTGFIRSDSDLGSITLSEAEVTDLSKLVGPSRGQSRKPYQLPKPIAPATPQIKPVIPIVPQRRPAVVEQRIPVVPKPQIISRPVVLGAFDQRIRYTGNRLTTPVLQNTVRRIIPGQVIGGISTVQGVNMQFGRDNTERNTLPGNQGMVAPKLRVSPQAIPKPGIVAPIRPKPEISFPILPTPELNSDVIELNRQLMKKQSEEEIKRTLAGFVRADSDLETITLSEAEITDLSKRFGSRIPKPAPQLRNPYLSPKPIAPSTPQIKPAVPIVPQRTPAVVEQRIPVVSKPQIISRPVVLGAFDQRIRYTGNRLTTPVLQNTVRTIIPGQAIGGISTVQGVNMQFGLDNTERNTLPGNQGMVAPKLRVSPQAVPKPEVVAPVRPKPEISFPILPTPELNTDIIQLNRQLMQKQSEEEIKRTLAGFVRADSDLGSITLSEAEVTDLSKLVGPGAPNAAPQLRKPYQLPKPITPITPQIRSGAQSTLQRNPAVLGQRISVIPKPQIIGRVPAALGGFSYSGNRLTTVGLQGFERRIIPGQTIGGISTIEGQNMQFVPVNTAGNIVTRNQGMVAPKPKVSPQVILKPQMIAPILPNPQIMSPILPQPELNTHIIELNRQLMQKQSEEEIKRTLAGFVGADSDLETIALSEAEITDLSKRFGSRNPIPVPQYQLPKKIAPETPVANVAPQRTPAVLGQRIPAVPKPQIIGRMPAAMREFDQPIKYTGNRLMTSGVQNLGNQRLYVPQPRFSAEVLPKPQISAPPVAKPGVSLPIVSAPGLNTDIIELNRHLMQKQGEAELRQAFSGVIREDSDLNKISLSAAELSELSRSISGRVSGPSSMESVIPVPYTSGIVDSQRLSTGSSRQASLQNYRSVLRGSVVGSRPSTSQSDLNKASKIQVVRPDTKNVAAESVTSALEIQEKIEPTLSVAEIQEPITQSKLTQTVKPFNSQFSQTVQKMVEPSNQLQMKIDDVIEHSELSKSSVVDKIQLERNTDVPTRSSKIPFDNLNQKYFQEKLPVDIPG